MFLPTDPYKSTLKSLALRLYATSDKSSHEKPFSNQAHGRYSYISNKQVKMTKSVKRIQNTYKRSVSNAICGFIVPFNIGNGVDLLSLHAGDAQ